MTLPDIKIKRKTGDESLHINGDKLPFKLLGFWQWSSSRLLDNALRGIFAEYIVACDLGCSDGVRIEWNIFDLSTNSGKRIEVKSAAYLQSWEQKKYSTISFSVAPTRGLDKETNAYSGKKKRNADFYVFCLLAHKDQKTIDPLNMSQWKFFILPTSILNERIGEQKSLSLSTLLKLEPKEVPFGEISNAIEHWEKL